MNRFFLVLALLIPHSALAADPLTASTPTKTLTCESRELPAKSCLEEAEFHEARIEIMRAKDLYEDLCNQKNGDGCYRLGLIYRDSGTKKKMSSFYEKGCDLKHEPSCAQMKVVEKAKEKIAAGEGDRHAQCTKTTRQICYDAAMLHRETGEIAPAISYLVTACQGGGAKSCLALGEIARASESPVEAKLRFTKACELRSKEGCTARKSLP